MNSFSSLCGTLLLVVVVQGGTSPTNKDGTWGSPMGWNGGPVNVQMGLAGEVVGEAGVFGEQAVFTQAIGNPSNVGLIIIDAGTGGNTYQTGSSYQQTASNPQNPSSAGSQSTSFSNNAIGFDYVSGVGEGDYVDVANVGDSAVVGSGAVASIDVLTGQAGEAGWKAT